MSITEGSIRERGVRALDQDGALPIMSEGLADRLNASLDALVAEGFEIRRIFASAKDIAQIFIEVGEDAILFDANPAVDLAWYRNFALSADEADGVRLLYCRGDECWMKDVDAAAAAAAA